MKKTWIAVTLVLVLLVAAGTGWLVFRPADAADTADTAGAVDVLTFAEFLNMTPAEQQAYMDSYEDITDFLEWYRTAEEQYQAEQSDEVIEGDGTIDIGEYID